MEMPLQNKSKGTSIVLLRDIGICKGRLSAPCRRGGGVILLAIFLVKPFVLPHQKESETQCEEGIEEHEGGAYALAFHITRCLALREYSRPEERSTLTDKIQQDNSVMVSVVGSRPRPLTPCLVSCRCPDYSPPMARYSQSQERRQMRPEKFQNTSGRPRCRPRAECNRCRPPCSKR